MICVLKRDGTSEPFDRYKLRGCLLGLLKSLGEELWHAEVLSSAVGQYLRRRGIRCITSAALLEMVLTALRISGLGDVGGELERRHRARLGMRNRLVLDHGSGVRTAWSKDWLVGRLRARWGLGRAAARVLAGEVELDLMARGSTRIGREEVARMLTERVASCGLAAPDVPRPANTAAGAEPPAAL
ncbi:MAG: ATP cone domain-containing protein [Planctomycetota bacterium]|jgi:hypothetical protein